jgi:arsenite methyltransferase
MSSSIEFDTSASRRIEAAYLTADVVAQRVEVLDALDVRPGERVLDIGSGPGLLAEAVAAVVGSSGRACGIDTSEPMLEMARGRCEAHPQADFELADASKLPFPDSSFDAAVSTQVYEYVADMPSALVELFRVLRPGGRIAIVDTDYDSLVIHTEDPERMSRVLRAWDEHFVHRGLPRVLTPLLRDAGFAVGRRSAIPILNPEYHPGAFSYHLTQMMAAFAVGRCGVSKAEADAWLAELQQLGERGDYFYSLNRYLFLAQRPG